MCGGFRKDVIADLRQQGSQEREGHACGPRPVNLENACALLKELKLPDSDAKAKAGQLFKTTLAKSLLSSPGSAGNSGRNRSQAASCWLATPVR